MAELSFLFSDPEGVANFVIRLLLLLGVARIPYKRRVHKVFLLFLATEALSYPLGLLSQVATTAELSFVLTTMIPGWFEWPLIFTVALTFATPKLNRTQNYVLLAIYAMAFGLNISSLLNPSVETTSSLGIFLIHILSPSTVIILLRHYLSEQPSVEKLQSRYLLVASVMALLVAWSGEWGGILSYIFPAILSPIGDIGDISSRVLTPAAFATLYLGFRKHGFGPVNPTAEERSQGPVKWTTRPGTSYLALDAQPKRAFEVFSDLVRHGRFGLCVTRQSPDTIRESYGLKATPIRWLTRVRREDAIAPSDLLGLSLTVVNFVQNATQPVVILHGLEYLISVDEFRPVLKLIQRLNDVITEKKGILILPLVPGSIGEQAQAQLIAECTELPRTQDV